MRIEERIKALEKQVADLDARLTILERPKDWRKTIGMFSGDEGMKEIFAEGQRIREQERKQARRPARKRPKRVNK